MAEDRDLNGQLEAVLSAVQENKSQQKSEMEKFGTVLSETKEKFDALQKQVDEIDKKMAEAHKGASRGASLEEELREDARLQDWIKTKRGTCFVQIKGRHIADLLERKTTIDSAALGSAVSGVLQIDRRAGIVEEARQTLRLRNVLSARPTNLPTVDFVKVNSAPTVASLQLAEGVAKIENAVTFTTASAYVKTIATWIPMTRQAMDDFDELMGYLRIAMPYYVNLREEIEFLHGGGGSTDIQGLVTAATAFQTALGLPVYNKSDNISAAIQQIEIANETDGLLADSPHQGREPELCVRQQRNHDRSLLGIDADPDEQNERRHIPGRIWQSGGCGNSRPDGYGTGDIDGACEFLC
jgi:HK97 family phage major capsid protein